MIHGHDRRASFDRHAPCRKCGPGFWVVARFQESGHWTRCAAKNTVFDLADRIARLFPWQGGTDEHERGDVDGCSDG